MSLNRENVIWQSKDATWNLGFFAFEYVNENSEDFDHEWDVEYLDCFNWVSTGHPTADAAERSWRGANPGGFTLIAHTPASAAECARYDRMATEARKRRVLR